MTSVFVNPETDYIVPTQKDLLLNHAPQYFPNINVNSNMQRSYAGVLSDGVIGLLMYNGEEDSYES